MPAIPHGPAARDLPPCDLVMKGGITSGIVYPSLVITLATRYRFASIGGTSAGAIAGALTAAAEYGRQLGNAGGLGRFAEALQALSKRDAILDLFQPTPPTSSLFLVLRRAGLSRSRSPVWRLAFTARVAARKRARVAAVGVFLALGVLATIAGAFVKFPLGVWIAWTLLVALPLLGIVILATAAAAIGDLLRQTISSLAHWDFGICPGTQQPGFEAEALIDWLHKHIQRCAGKPIDEPLTFRDLADQGINLTMITTDLSLARPVRLPDCIGAYSFDVERMRQRFPATVVDAMVKASPPVAGYATMPTDDLPVVVGVRLSLSFPILMSAMALHQRSPRGDMRTHLLSDGGISSNFPMHFFDAWFPRHPTFGIDLAHFPEGNRDEVFMLPDPRERAIPRWDPVASLPAFFALMKDTAQNWRDTLQSELPGFRDRVCQIRFDKGQGGLYLDMTDKDVEDLVQRGARAGELILETWTEHQWDQHRWVRYLMTMGLLEDNLQRAGMPFAAFEPRLRAGLDDVDVYRDGHDAQWCVGADQATAALLALAGGWGRAGPVGFRAGETPTPEPVMRAVPRA
jgi:predicted acylesterase/phospholipase RssA